MPALVNTRSQYQQLSTTYLIVGLVVFVVVVGTLVVVLIRYRAGRGGKPSRKHEANLVESLYVLGLIGIVAYLLTITYKTLNNEDGMRVTAQTSRQTVNINVIAAQWNWRFDYPPPRGQRKGATVTLVASPLQSTVFYVPVDRPVLFRGWSQDVLHQFWIPALRYKRQVWPDHVETWALVFPRAGRYQGLCNWFCGLYHQNMHFVAIALPPKQFDAWLARKRSEATA